MSQCALTIPRRYPHSGDSSRNDPTFNAPNIADPESADCNAKPFASGGAKPERNASWIM
jgi:hypothetical protein